jgi:type II secretory pathway component PulJ
MLAQFRDQRGNTLIEGLITVGIISLILSLTVAIFLQTVKHDEKTMTDLTAESQARIAMTKVTNDLRQAMPKPGSTTLPVSSPVMPAAGTAPTPQPNVTFTEVNSLTTLNFLSPTYNTITIGFDAVNHTITRVVNGGAAQVLEHDVTAFSVTPITCDEYQVNLTEAPKHRAQVSSPPFSVVSSIFISYYKTNYSGTC